MPLDQRLGNTNSASAVEVDTAEQFAIYDGLSPGLRRLVDALPAKSDLRVIRQMLAMGMDEIDVTAVVVKQIMGKYPGWRYRP